MNRRTIIITAAAAVALVGGAGAAVAAGTDGTSGSTPSATATSSPTTGATGTKAHHHGTAFRGEYAQWTTYDAKSKADVVHDGIRGSVSAVSPTSITVTAKDGKAETFAVSGTTKVGVKGDAKGTAGSIGQVKVGDRVVVVGTGSGSYAATHVSDRGAATAAKTAPAG